MDSESKPWFLFPIPHINKALILILIFCSDHVNDYCALSMNEQEPKMWMCYAGGVGFGGYAGYGGYDRRIRMYEFDMNEGRITTWKRLENAEDKSLLKQRIDEQLAVDAGKAHPPPEDVNDD